VKRGLARLARLALASLLLASPTRALAAFVNGDFESGNFNGWTLQYGYFTAPSTITGWTTTLPSGFPAPAVVTAATANQPGQTNGVVPFQGNSMARINDILGGRHATRLSQSIVLTAADLTVGGYLRLEWGAALVDPNHAAGSQPFFLIQVISGTGTLASFGADATAAAASNSGWVNAGSSGGTRDTLWYRRGSFCLPVAHLVGQSLTVQITVADCEQGGHGGFAYLDDVRFGDACCPDSMLLHHAFDDAGDRGLDGSGNGIVGTIGAATVVPGKCGDALRFQPDNNVQEYSIAAVGNPGNPNANTLLNITGAMSGMAWIRPRGQQSTDNNPSCPQGTIFAKGGSYWFQVDKNNDQLVFQNEGSGAPGTLATAAVTLPLNAWSLVGFVRGPMVAGSQPVQFYLNGQPVGAAFNLTVPGAPNNEPVMIGNYGFLSDPGACEFNGDIDEVKIFDRALTADDMLGAFLSCPCTPRDPCDPEVGLVINTGWEQATGSVFSDGDADNEWVVVSDPDPNTSEPRPAFVIPQYSAWQPPQANSKWISSYPNAAQETNGHYILEYRFCLLDTIGASITTTVRADDRATLILNGTTIGFTPASNFSSVTPATIGTTNSSLFVPGENVLRVDLENLQRVAMGLNLSGIIQGNVPQYIYCCKDSASTIQGTKWNDLNADGIKDPGEPVLSGWTIVLSNGQTTVTDVFGNYYFTGLVPGTYSVSEVAQADWTQTSPLGGSYVVSLALGQVLTGLNFGNRGLSRPAGPLRGIDWLHDAFPRNALAGLPGTSLFDTTTALIKTGRNIAQTTGNLLRFDVPGDSLTACACGDSVRMDFVFRVLPGPGNFQIAGGRSMPPGGQAQGILLKLPTDQSQVVSSGDDSFWGTYMANNGPFGSPGGHLGGTKWDQHTWNSARMDTAEFNIFPVEALGDLPGIRSCIWSGTYHESDPKYAVLGINKFRCFVIDTTKAATSGPSLANVLCDGTVPAWATTVPSSRTGWDGVSITKEYTKIIPDGLLTPGSHVQYFLRRSSIQNPSVFTMLPDTNRVLPQYDELGGAANQCATTGGVYSDGHRWQQISVLPDRWKDAAFGGSGAACMLYVDVADGSGDEYAWVSVADLIGATGAPKWGAHNGWHIDDLTDDPNDPSNFVRKHGGQPGTTWDLYSVRNSNAGNDGFAGSIGSRLSNASSPGYVAGKLAAIGPTPEMLRTYYGIVYLTTGDMEADVLGPLADRSQDDVAILQDFAATSGGTAQPRGLYLQGNGIATSLAGGPPPQLGFLNAYMRSLFRDPSYMNVSNNVGACPDLLPTSVVSPAGAIYGVTNPSSPAEDVLLRNPATPSAVDAVYYEPQGVGVPYVASVVGTATVTQNWVSQLDGFRLASVESRHCANVSGRLGYMYHVLTQVFASSCPIAGPPSQTVGVDDSRIPLRTDLRLSRNPARTGGTDVRFSLAKADWCDVSVLDASGRRVRQLASGYTEAGTRTLSWDGRDSNGSPVRPGVYFLRLRARTSGVSVNRTLVLLQ
jgi:hypothetical protein